MKLGAQLYTVRAFTKDLDSFAETLKKVADMGYTSVQVSGTCEFNPAWLADELKKNGKEAIIKFSKWTLTEEMVGDTVVGDMSFKQYIEESFK